MNQAASDWMVNISFILLVLVATTLALFSTHIFAQAVLTTDLPSINFGNQQINEESDPVTLTLMNIGDDSATGISCAVVNRPPHNDAGDPLSFTVATCPATLPSGAFSTVNVTFTPVVVDLVGASLRVFYNDGVASSDSTISLDGTGVELSSDCDTDGDGIVDSTDTACWGGSPPPASCTGGSTTDCLDNCPATSNPNQEDLDSDGVGDACDLSPLIFRDSFEDSQ